MSTSSCGDKYCSFCGTHCAGCGLREDARSVLLDLTTQVEQYMLDPRRTLDKSQLRATLKTAKEILDNG